MTDVGQNPSHLDHLPTLIALITNLAQTKRKSRTAKYIASDLDMEPAIVEHVLDRFRAYFRRSDPNRNGAVYYTLHYRHARWAEGDDEDRTTPLSDSETRMLIDLVVNIADREASGKQAQTGVWVAAGSAVVAALVAVVVGLFPVIWPT